MKTTRRVALGVLAVGLAAGAGLWHMGRKAARRLVPQDLLARLQARSRPLRDEDVLRPHDLAG